MHFLVATGAKVLSALVVIKLLALYFGPNGFGLLSQLMGLVAIASMLAGGGVTNGVIKVLSVDPGDTPEGQRWIANAIAITLAFSSGLALILVGCASLISDNLLQGQFYPAILVLAVAQFMVGIGSLLLAEASSQGDSRKYAAINVIGTVAGAILVAAGAYWYGLIGAAFATVLSPAMLGIVGIAATLRGRHAVIFVRPEVDWVRVRHLLSFSSLTLVGALSVPLAQMFIREAMASDFSWENVGLWQGAAKISDVYMQFVGVILINHALPRFSNSDIRGALQELKRIVTWLLGFLALGFGILWSFRDFAIALVFSDAFLPMQKYFLPQMIGDLLRTTAAAFSFFLLARGQIRVPLGFEFAQGIGLFLFFELMAGIAGEMAPVYAHIATYLVLVSLMAWQLRQFLRVGATHA
jgi:O-antigen/teichoic acid export membrane protein